MLGLAVAPAPAHVAIGIPTASHTAAPAAAPQPGRDTLQGARVDREARSVTISATLQTSAFLGSLPPDHQYHALVHADGGAANGALFVTPTPDTVIARALRELGAEDDGGLPLASWTLRWLPLVPQPSRHVTGTPVEVRVAWEGAPRLYTLEELLHDPGGRGAEIRFGGNEEHDEHWPSGCIICLFSCPGGVLSNAAYSIRDHQRGVTSFEPSELLPPDGTSVTITLALAAPG